MKNIVLIGMPGTGKSVVGRALAQRLDYTFVDVDDLIVEKTGKTLPEILRTQGLEAFLAIEEQVGQSLECSNTVVATGGSMVLSEKAMEHLCSNGVAVWLETPSPASTAVCPRIWWIGASPLLRASPSGRSTASGSPFMPGTRISSWPAGKGRTIPPGWWKRSCGRWV